MAENNVAKGDEISLGHAQPAFHERGVFKKLPIHFDELPFKPSGDAFVDCTAACEHVPGDLQRAAVESVTAAEPSRLRPPQYVRRVKLRSTIGVGTNGRFFLTVEKLAGQ